MLRTRRVSTCLFGILMSLFVTALAQSQESNSPAPPALATTSPAAPTAPGLPAAAQAGPRKPSPTPVSPFEQGLVAFHVQNFQQAAPKFAEAGAPATFQGAIALAWLARTNLHLHKIEEAEQAARKAIEVAPNSAAAQSAMAEVLFRQANFTEAEDILKKLVKLQTSEARVYLALSRLYTVTGNYKAAKTCMDLAHKLDEEDPDIYAEWVDTLPRSERLEEWKKRLANGIYEDERERGYLLSAVTVLEDEARQSERSCKLVEKKLPMETKFESLLVDAKTLRGYGLAVKINDTSSRLLVDTGASGILINSKIAEKAGVARVADQKIAGIGDKGASSGYVGFASRLQIGNLVFENCYVDVVDKKNSLGEDGLIGTDVFSDFLVELDFPDVKLRLSELPAYPDAPSASPGLTLGQPEKGNLHNRWIPPQFSDYERVYRFGHMLLIPATINKSARKMFLVDTGGWDNFVSPAAARGNVKIHSDSDITVKGLSGKVDKVYTTDRVTLTFGHFKQERYDMVAFDLTDISNDAGTEISGSLGFAMLYMLDLKIDYRDHLVDFAYDPNRFH